jgi:type VI secretion system protein VasJ
MLSGLLKALFPSRDAEQLTRSRLEVWRAWLQPLAGEGGIGRDPGYEDLFFELKDESARLSGIDDALIIRSCEQLLKETGKDLRVGSYHAQARLRQDGPAGFADGLELVAALIDRFGEAILPTRAEAKKGALELLATARTIELLDSRGRISNARLRRSTCWSRAPQAGTKPLARICSRLSRGSNAGRK